MSEILKPQPVWRQKRAYAVAWWKKNAIRRRSAYTTLKNVGLRALTLAISTLGAILVAFGVYETFEPAGYIVGGLLLWLIQWNYGDKEGDG